MRNKKFKINEFLSLELCGHKTLINVNNTEFMKCKYVLLDISIENFDQYYSIDSIDDIMDNMDHSLEVDFANDYPDQRIISPEEEFWVHCSNLHVWAEHGYNS